MKPFLMKKAKQSNEQAIIALLILGAIEKNNTTLLEKLDVPTIKNIIRQYRLRQLQEAIAKETKEPIQ